MRPLPKVMLDYARMDSWVLLILFPLLIRDLESKGIDSDRMNSKGNGEENPIDTNDTEEGRANNRRVELSIE